VCHKWQGIIESVRDSKVKLQLLLFFYNNPFTVDDLEGVSIWVGMHKEEIAAAMEELCRMELLVRHGRQTHPYYAFTENTELVGVIHDLVERFCARLRSKAS